MSFQISALPVAPFVPLFGLDDAALLARNVRRCRADETPGFPCRVSLADAPVGATLLLMNFEHQPARSPYRASGPIFVQEHTVAAAPAPDEVPQSLRLRLLSLRAYDGDDLITAAEVVEGRDLEPMIARLFEDVGVTYIHAHYARRGCYAARIDRVSQEQG